MNVRALSRLLPIPWAGRFPSGVAALLAACALGLPAQHEKDRDRKPAAPAKPAAEAHREPKPEARREVRLESGRPEPRREVRSEPPRPEPRKGVQMEQRRDPAPLAGARAERTPGGPPSSRRESSGPPATRKEAGTRPGPARETAPRETVPRDGHADRPGGFFDARPTPAREVVKARGGGEIHRAPGGAIREVRTAGGAVIRHAPSGVRLVEVARPGGRVIVANATGRRGYLQRPLVVHNHTFVQRTYVLNGVPRARIYRPWIHAGWTYHVYAPVYYYRPAYYTWCYTPWRRPVRYVWGWEARPWYGYYGGYFRPYRTYVSPSYWLADFLLATTLEAAYLAQRASVEAPPVTYSTTTALSPEVKDAIADEVRRQMDLERAEREASRDDRGDVTPVLFSERGPRVFVVANPLMASSGGQECALSEGDVLELSRRPSPSSELAEVRVLASRSGNCAKGSLLTVRCTDLQEMQNHLRATLDDGMSTLQKEQGRNGLPTLPKDAMGTDRTAYADEVRPDADAVEQITQATQEANRAEQDMINQGPQDPGAAGAATISLGMTIEEVERVLGRPRNTADLGAKKIYIYKDLKITFLNGKVSDVQ